MRDHDDRAEVFAKRFFEDLARLDVEVVGRLVEYEHVRRTEQHFRESEPRLLPPREHTDGLLDVVA